jgi:hypothetical protein
MLEKYARPAASDVGTTNPDLIVFGCTSAGSLFGLDYDAEFCATLGKLAGCPSLGVINAASRALSAAAARKIALIPEFCNITRGRARVMGYYSWPVMTASTTTLPFASPSTTSALACNGPQTREIDVTERQQAAEKRSCGAKTRAGHPCRRQGSGRGGRCPNHGGASTGPLTKAGRQRISAAERRRWQAWREARSQN